MSSLLLYSVTAPLMKWSFPVVIVGGPCKILVWNFATLVAAANLYHAACAR